MDDLPFEIEDEFRNALSLFGLYPKKVVADGAMQIFSVTDDAINQSSGWYILSRKKTYAVFGNYKTGLVESWNGAPHKVNEHMKDKSFQMSHKHLSNNTLNIIDREVILERCSEIVPEPISWLWRHWIPAGKLTILAGDMGASKSTLSLSLAATISNGGYWPDGTLCENKGKVLIWSSEDTFSNTIVPRLTAAGADLDRCFHIKGIRQDREKKAFDPSQDMPGLQRLLRQSDGVDLLIIDPIVSAISGDMHRANEVRRSLQAVIDFAEEHKCAVIGITHVSKGSAGRTPHDRVIGSQAFGALARVVLIAAKDEDGSRRILARAKSNIGPDTGGIEYSVVETSFCSIKNEATKDRIETSYIEWGKILDGSARDLLGQVEVSENNRQELNSKLKKMLIEKIQNAGGQMLSAELEKEVLAAGYSWDKAKKVKRQLGIEAVKLGMDGSWAWRLSPSDIPT
ncbi:AAA family ATPase [Massilia phyllosphaerae]|uniref:AAA family ATPase n=1 Tax=Massilia phyllosphaerae TaxID=3106034 RepID=UPI002B1CCF4A|nr:AAA family ATPase [Massilia sp. SGZ-792]